MRLNHQNFHGLFWLALAVFCAFALLGCGAKGQPAEFNQTAGEMKEGPGVFTGESGEFTVYDSKKGGPFWEQSQKEAQKSPGASGTEPQASSGKTAVVAGETVPERPVSDEEAREFQEFQEWKREKKEFQEFREWKESKKGSAEYQEFREWQEFKSYQEWKNKKGQ